MKKNARQYGKLRARLIERGTNPRRWAMSRGFPVSSVYSAIAGNRAGVSAIRILRQLEEYLAS